MGYKKILSSTEAFSQLVGHLHRKLTASTKVNLLEMEEIAPRGDIHAILSINGTRYLLKVWQDHLHFLHANLGLEGGTTPSMSGVRLNRPSATPATEAGAIVKALESIASRTRANPKPRKIAIPPKGPKKGEIKSEDSIGGTVYRVYMGAGFWSSKMSKNQATALSHQIKARGVARLREKRSNPSSGSVKTVSRADKLGYSIVQVPASMGGHFVIRDLHGTAVDKASTLQEAKAIRSSLWRYHQMKGEVIGTRSNPTRRRKESALRRRIRGDRDYSVPDAEHGGDEYGHETVGRARRVVSLFDYSNSRDRDQGTVAVLRDRHGRLADYKSRGGQDWGQFEEMVALAEKGDRAERKARSRSRGKTHAKALKKPPKKSTRHNPGYYAGPTR